MRQRQGGLAFPPAAFCRNRATGLPDRYKTLANVVVDDPAIVYSQGRFPEGSANSCLIAPGIRGSFSSPLTLESSRMNWKQIAGTFASMALTTTPVLASQGGAGGGGGGGGGAVSPATANPLPASAPAPGVLFRESFGPGADPALARPTSGNGKLRSVFAGTSLGGFWVEWPGSKASTWSAANGAWVFAFAS